MSVNIHGKQYVTVNERLMEFYQKYPKGRIKTEIISDNGDSCVMKATIYKDESYELASTGHAQEDRSSSRINKTSYIENCETSAVGRALAMMGFSIDASIASADEVSIAIAKQEIEEKITFISDEQLKNISNLLGHLPDERVKKCYKAFNITDLSKITISKYNEMLPAIQKAVSELNS